MTACARIGMHLLDALTTPRGGRMQAAGVRFPHLGVVVVRLQLVRPKIALQELRHHLHAACPCLPGNPCAVM